MASRRRVELRWGQQHELAAYRDHDPRPYVRERCAAVLKIAEGHAAYWVARHGLLKVRDPDTVSGWVTRSQADGLAGLLAHRQGGDHRRRLRPGAGGSHRASAASATRRGGASGGGRDGEEPAAQSLDAANDSCLGPGLGRLQPERRLAHAAPLSGAAALRPMAVV
jgi:hypothetical protein